MSFVRRIQNNIGFIVKSATKRTVGVYAALGLIGAFVSLSDFFGDNTSFLCQVIISLCILACVWLIFASYYLVFALFKNKYELFELNGGYHVYVQYADIFSDNALKGLDKKRSIVIPVNRCFDTDVDNDLVSENSLHGMALKKIYSSGKYNSDSLYAEIQEKLAEQDRQHLDLTKDDKRKGRLKRYPVGSVAEISLDDNCTFFFVALSTFDSNLKATTSDDDYVLALMRMIEYCGERSFQYPVLIPLIGGGLSRSEKTEKDILEFVITLLKINKRILHSDVHIVVRKSGKNSISINDL